MNQVKIVSAGINDLALLLEWRRKVIADVFAPVDDEMLTRLVKENEDYYRRAFADGSHIACFAELDGTIRGCGGICLQHEMPSPDNPDGLCAYLMNIYVEPGSRHLGIGRTIVETLVGMAQGVGAQKIYLEATKEGRQLYAEAGFKPMDDMMKFTE